MSVTLILGERDMMTPARAGKALAAALPNSRTVVLPGAGHMMMVERPDELPLLRDQLNRYQDEVASQF